MVLELKKDIVSLETTIIKNQFEIRLTDKGYDILKTIAPNVLFCSKIPLVIFDNKNITNYGDIKVCIFNKDKKYIAFATNSKSIIEPYSKTNLIKQRFIEKIKQ